MSSGPTAVVRIKAAYRDMGAKDKEIANYVLSNLQEVSRSSISDLSSHLDMADSTIFQFTKRLGYEGFRDFKIALLTEENDPQEKVSGKILEGDSEETIIHKVFQANIHALEEADASADPHQYHTALAIITSSDSTTFFGLGQSNAVALDAYQKFLRTGIRCNYCTDFHMQLMNAALLSENDCAVVISHTGRSREVIELAETIHEHKAKMILVTAYSMSPFARMADAILITPAAEDQHRTEAHATRISELAVLDALFVLVQRSDEKDSEKNWNRIREIMDKTKERVS